MRVSGHRYPESDRVGRDHACVVGERPVVVFDDLRRGQRRGVEGAVRIPGQADTEVERGCVPERRIDAELRLQAAEHDLVDAHPAERLLKRCVVKGAAVALGNEDIRIGSYVQLLHQLPRLRAGEEPLVFVLHEHDGTSGGARSTRSVD